MIYLDTNVFLFPLLNPPAAIPARNCIKILLKVATGEIKAATSFLTWDEFFYVLKRRWGREHAVAQGNKLLAFPNLTFLNVNQRVVVKAQALVSEIEIAPRDALHAASALINDIGEILTDDVDFDKVKELKRISPTSS